VPTRWPTRRWTVEPAAQGSFSEGGRRRLRGWKGRACGLCFLYLVSC
jgi:hypothetical protein